jgi:hypothetical protein
MRARDLFLEFFQSAPLAQPVNSTSFAKDFLSLVHGTKSLPNTSPARVALFDIFQILKKLYPAAQKESAETTQSNISALDHLTEATVAELFSRIQMTDPVLATKLAAIIHKLDQEMGPISASDAVVKAKVSAIKTIELNTKGEIGKLDSDIEATAKQFAKRFNVKEIWARNLVGMFSVSIPQADRKKFLDACLSGSAIDINAMITQKHGSIDNVVNTKVPKLKEVYDSVKATLLDISLSTGQRGATGPFEAMLAIMGGANKPSSAEGGDLVINGKKYEVKSTSLSPSSRLKKDGTLPNTGGINQAWLDSGPGGEVGGSFLKKLGTDWILKKAPSLMSNSKFKELWAAADFRPSGISNLKLVFKELNKKLKEENAGYFLISYMMSQFFPAAVDTSGFKFYDSTLKMYMGIINNEPEEIATEQGIMALIAYLAKGNDGFILFNSSVQEYRIIDGTEDVLEIYQNPSKFDIKFNTMTMGRAQKASPGIYFGPNPTSEKAKKYFEFYNSDPKRVELRKLSAEQENNLVPASADAQNSTREIR